MNSTIIDGLNSAGNNTIGSLRLMLTQSDKEKLEPNYGLNLVGLAKSAGFKTYWISNQGYIGKHDTPITFIAKHADVKNSINSVPSILMMKVIFPLFLSFKKN